MSADDFVVPVQVLDGAVHGCEEDSQILLATEHQMTGDRRDQLDLGRKGVYDCVDVIRLGCCTEPRD